MIFVTNLSKIKKVFSARKEKKTVEITECPLCKSKYTTDNTERCKACNSLKALKFTAYSEKLIHAYYSIDGREFSVKIFPLALHNKRENCVEITDENFNKTKAFVQSDDYNEDAGVFLNFVYSNNKNTTGYTASVNINMLSEISIKAHLLNFK